MIENRDILTIAMREYPTRIFSKKSTILHQGEVPRSVYIIKKGIVKAYSISALGEEQIVTFFTAGEILPASWLLNQSSNSLYYHESVTECEVYMIPRMELIELTHKPEIMTHLMKYYMSNYVGSLVRITALEQPRATDKILYTFYYLLMKYGAETRPGSFAIELSLTHQTLAHLVGITRETMSLELQKLKKQGIISHKDKSYHIDRKALISLIGEDNFRELTVGFV